MQIFGLFLVRFIRFMYQLGEVNFVLKFFMVLVVERDKIWFLCGDLVGVSGGEFCILFSYFGI